MPILIDKEVDDDVRFGIWEIKESFNELRHLVSLRPEEIKRKKQFLSRHRKMEFLSVRALFQTMLDKEFHYIKYNKARKPLVNNNTHNISITHSSNFTAVMLSKEYRVGIDLECMSNKIRHISHKFINDNELITSQPESVRYHLYIHWCAKEALFKILDKPKINFKEDLTIQPFTPEKEGLIKGFVKAEGYDEVFDLHYARWGDYVIVYTYKKK